MSEVLDDVTLAEALCGELLSAADLKGLCRVRGFPLTQTGKDGLAKSAASRLLEPLGVAEAMSTLDERWLSVLHLVAASEKPLPLAATAHVGRPDDPHYDIDHRALWRSMTDGLLARGLLLADERGEPPRHEKSRYARLRLVFPNGFREFLPPFPIPSEPLQGTESLPSLDAVYRRALGRFLTRKEDEKKTGRSLDLGEKLVALFSLDHGRLRLRDVEQPTAEILARKLAGCWESTLSHRGKHEAPVAAGRMARHILNHVPKGLGCGPASLAKALDALGIEVKEAAVSSFCEEGAAAGLLVRSKSSRGTVLYGVPDPAGAPSRPPVTLTVKPQQGGVQVDLEKSSLLAILAAAALSCASVKAGELVLEPDLVRMGRVDLAENEVIRSLRSASSAFDAAAKTVLERRGQVIVHRGLTVLRVEDVGLRALVLRKFGSAVRELDGGYLAVLSGQLHEILALTKREGFAARRLP